MNSAMLNGREERELTLREIVNEFALTHGARREYYLLRAIAAFYGTEATYRRRLEGGKLKTKPIKRDKGAFAREILKIDDGGDWWNALPRDEKNDLASSIAASLGYMLVEKERHPDCLQRREATDLVSDLHRIVFRELGEGQTMLVARTIDHNSWTHSTEVAPVEVWSRDAIEAALAVAAREVSASPPRIPDGWTLVPNVGTEVRADHPITTFYPKPTFQITYVEHRGHQWFVRGDETCWFNVSLVHPASSTTETPPDACSSAPADSGRASNSASERQSECPAATVDPAVIIEQAAARSFAIRQCIKIATDLTTTWGNPKGSAYARGADNHGRRIVNALREVESINGYIHPDVAASIVANDQRDAAIEECAKWHEKQSDRLEPGSVAPLVYPQFRDMLIAARHRTYAAALRTLKSGAKA